MEAAKKQQEMNRTNHANQGQARGFGTRTQTAGIGVKDLLTGGYGMPTYQEPKVAKVNVRVSFVFTLRDTTTERKERLIQL